MQSSKKILITFSILLATFFCVHFSLIIGYVMPVDWKSGRVQSYSNMYANPIFHQGWVLFAPVPREKSRLYYRFYDNGSWSDEISFEQDMRNENHFLAPRAELKIAHYLGYELRKNTVKLGDGSMDYKLVKHSNYYRRSSYAVLRYLKSEKDITPDSIELILERELYPKMGYSKKKTIRDYLEPDATR